MSDPVIRVEGLGKRYRIGAAQQRHTTLREALTEGARRAGRVLLSPLRSIRERAATETFWALRDVSFEVAEGEVVGIIGGNGAGKSTLLKILSRITEPTEGDAWIHGRVGSLLEVGTGFHPELSGRENVYLNGAILGMGRREIDAKFDEIVAFAEVEKFIDTPVKWYSSGMYLRLAFAVAAHLEPEILIVDEVLAVGDAAFQRKCLGKMGDVAREGRTVVFVSHNATAVQRLCDRCVWLKHGRVADLGLTASIVSRYLATTFVMGAPTEWIDVSGLPRHGTGEASFRELRYTSGSTDAAFQPYPEGPLEVLVSVHAKAPCSVGSFAITLFDQNGVKLVNADALALGRHIQLRRGRNVVRLRIARLHLKPGVYLLGLWMSDALGNVFDMIDAALNLEVVDHRGRMDGVPIEGVVTCDFEIEEVEAFDEPVTCEAERATTSER